MHAVWPWICVASFTLGIYALGTPPRRRGLRVKPQDPPDTGLAAVIMGLAIFAAIAAVLQPQSRTGKHGSVISADAAFGSAVVLLVMAVGMAILAARTWPRDPPDRKPLGLALACGSCMMIAITALGLW